MSIPDPIGHERGSIECIGFGMHAHGVEGTPGHALYRHGQPVTYRHTFKWRMPAATLVRPAERRRFDVRLNRYPGVVIGLAIQVGTRALSILWGRPGRVIYLYAPAKEGQ